MEPRGNVTDEPSEAEMRFVSKQPSARLLVLRRALRAFGNYHAIKRTDPHSEMTELRRSRSILL